MRVSSLYENRPLLDIGSYARRGPAHRVDLSQAEVAHIGRTLRRHPEVMVKVLPRGATTTRAVARHIAYIARWGDVELETDEGTRVSGRDSDELLSSWDRDLEEERPRAHLDATGQRRAPRLVHKVVFSMPAGTPPQKVLEAVRNFAREEFALKHRYLLALHTDEPHPHVHMVVKAMSEQGRRLNIRKATLRAWRSEFARHLRSVGVPANATERIVRGELRNSLPDRLYRMLERGAPMYRSPEADTERSRHVADRSKPSQYAVMNGWFVIAEALERAGHSDLAQRAGRFAEAAPRHRRLFPMEPLRSPAVGREIKAAREEDRFR